MWHSPLTGYPDQTLIRLAAGLPVSAGSGTIISTVSPGTLLTHFIITSTVDFAANSTPNITFTASTAALPLYPTRVGEFILSTSTLLPVTPGTNAIVTSNPVLNPPAPIAYSVTGGGSYCEGGSGVAVGLANSETGVTYTLIRGGSVEVLPTVPGTGSAISFGLQTVAGTYTVEGLNTGGTTLMTGSAVVSINPLPAVPASLAGSGADCSQITANWQSAANASSYSLDVSASATFATFVSGFQNRDVGNVLTYNVTGLTAGTTYYYRVRAVNSCGISGNSGTITYATSPATPAQPGVISGTTAQCPGVAGETYSVAIVPNASSYSWTVPTGWTITSASNTRIITVTTGGAGQGGDISVTASNSCGTSVARTLAVTVNPLPVQPGVFTASTATVCQGATGVAYTVPNDPTVSYTWSYSGTGATITGTTNSVTVSYSLSATSGTLSVTATNSCGTSTARTLVIAVNQVPAVPVIGTITQPTCFLSTGSIQLTGLPATGDWVITRTPGGTTYPGNGTTTTIGSLLPGTYTFTVTNSGGCVSPSSANGVINEQPVTPTAPVIGTITPPSCILATGSVELTDLPAGNWTLTRYPGGAVTPGSGSNHRHFQPAGRRI